MKKLLSFVLVAMMVLSSIAPCLAVNGEYVPPYPENAYLPELPEDVPDDANGVAWIEDGEIDPETNTVTVKFYVQAPYDGYSVFDLTMYYPDCLTITSIVQGDALDDQDYNQCLYNQTTAGHMGIYYPFISEENCDLLTEYGFKYHYEYGSTYPKDEEDFTLYFENFYGHLISFFPDTMADLDGDGVDESYDINYQGNLETYTFTYDASKNTFGDKIPILLLSDVDLNGSKDMIFFSGDDETEDGDCLGRDGSYLRQISYITVPAAEHEHTAGEAVVVAATCTTAGSSTVYCTEDGEVISTEEIPATGIHTPGEAVVVPATCTTAGSSTVSCTVCGNVIETTTIDALGHITGKKVTVQPTSESGGAWKYYCYRTNEFIDDEVYTLSKLDKFAMSVDNTTAAPGEEVTISVNATLPATGVWGTIVFAVWDKDLGKDVAIANGDLLREFDAADATEITDYTVKHYFDYYGITFGEDIADYYKSVLSCYPVGDDQSNVYGNGTLYTMTLTAPTEPGTYKYGYVIADDVIGSIWDDDAAAYIYDVDSRIQWATLTVEEAVHEHTPGEPVVVAATCTTAGSSTVYCTEDGEVISTEEIPATGHTPGEAVVVPATCTEKGSSTVYCTVDDVVISTEEIPATGHTPGEAVVVPATCTEKGSSTVYCTVDNVVISTEEIPATGHTAGEWTVVKEATADEAGLEELRCTIDNELIDSREIPVKSLDLGLEPGYFSDATQTVIDNATRTITLVSKANAIENDFRVILPSYAYTVVTTDADVTVIGDEHFAYFRSAATNGANQSYKLVVNDGEEDYEYTVNVVFVKGASCTGVEPGYFADSSLTGFAADDHVINVVSKPGAVEVDFRMLGLPAGAYPIVESGTVLEIQRVDGDYVDVRGTANRQNTQMTYFRSVISEGNEQSYTVNVVFVDGTTDTYTVNVQFVEQ